jgi:hypothetical protein
MAKRSLTFLSLCGLGLASKGRVALVLCVRKQKRHCSARQCLTLPETGCGEPPFSLLVQATEHRISPQTEHSHRENLVDPARTLQRRRAHRKGLFARPRASKRR